MGFIHLRQHHKCGMNEISDKKKIQKTTSESGVRGKSSLCFVEVIQVYYLLPPCRTVVSASVKMMKEEKKWAQRILQKQGQTSYSHGLLVGEWKAKAMNEVQLFFSMKAVCVLVSCGTRTPKGFLNQHWWALTYLLYISENSKFISSQPEILESAEGNSTEDLGAFFTVPQLHFL